MKTGIVGSGMIVKEFLENLQGMEGLELAAICGTPRREAYLQELCRSYGIRKWYTDYDAMVLQQTRARLGMGDTPPAGGGL